jgi:hypothetical protein
MLEKIQNANEKKRKLMVIGLIVAILFVFIVIRFVGSEDNWICQDGKWIKHGNPRMPKPTVTCPK